MLLMDTFLAEDFFCWTASKQSTLIVCLLIGHAFGNRDYLHVHYNVMEDICTKKTS